MSNLWNSKDIRKSQHIINKQLDNKKVRKWDDKDNNDNNNNNNNNISKFNANFNNFRLLQLRNKIYI